jgi:hypothetical protein
VGPVRLCVLVTLDAQHLAVGQGVATTYALGLLVVELDAALGALARVAAGTAPTLTLAAGALHRGVLHGLGKSHGGTSSPTPLAGTPEGYRRAVTRLKYEQAET